MEKIEGIVIAHIKSFMFVLLSTSKGSDDLSFGFLKDNKTCERELTNHKTNDKNYHLRMYLKDVFGFTTRKCYL